MEPLSWEDLVWTDLVERASEPAEWSEPKPDPFPDLTELASNVDGDALEKVFHDLSQPWPRRKAAALMLAGLCERWSQVRHRAAQWYHAAANPPHDPDGWVPVDLLAAEGTTMVRPEILPRTDGHCLFYRGKIHNLVGESESGKTFAAMAAMLSEVRARGRGLYIDYEDQAVTFIRRLRVLGATDAEVQAITYISVERRWDRAPLYLLANHEPTIVVLDGVTEGMGLMELDPLGTPDAAAWVRWVRNWAHFGACVITIDHVVKDKNGQGRWALGSQHKVSGIDGVHYVVEPDGVLRPGHESALFLKVGKDRSGGVREFAGEMLDHRMQLAGRLRFNLEGGAFEVTLPAPAAVPGVINEDSDRAFEANLRKLLDEVGAASMTAIEKGVKGVSTKRKRQIVAQLHADGILIARPKGTGVVYERDVAWTPSEPSEDPARGSLWS